MVLPTVSVEARVITPAMNVTREGKEPMESAFSGLRSTLDLLAEQQRSLYSQWINSLTSPEEPDLEAMREMQNVMTDLSRGCEELLQDIPRDPQRLAEELQETAYYRSAGFNVIIRDDSGGFQICPASIQLTLKLADSDEDSEARSE